MDNTEQEIQNAYEDLFRLLQEKHFAVSVPEIQQEIIGCSKLIYRLLTHIMEDGPTDLKTFESFVLAEAKLREIQRNGRIHDQKVAAAIGRALDVTIKFLTRFKGGKKE